MNRFEKISRLLVLEQAAVALRAKAAAIRDELTLDAQAEYAEQGTAPTWRLPDIGTVSLPVSKETVYVADEAALFEWVSALPGDRAEVIETVERIKPWYLHDLLRLVRVEDGQVIDEDGTIVPGLAVKPGGQPQSLSFRPSPDAKRVAAAGAEALVESLEQSIAGPVVLAEAPDASA